MSTGSVQPPFSPPSSSSPSLSPASPSSWSPLLLSVWHVLTGVVVPFSLSSAASRSLTRRSLSAVSGRAAALRPCDLVLVRTPGRFYELLRRCSRQPFDHLAVVMADGRVLHVGPPRIRLLPAELLLQPWRHPHVLRPRLSHSEAAAFLSSLSALVGRPYDTVKVLQLIALLATQQRRRQQRAAPASSPHAFSLSVLSSSPSSPLICTDAILHRLLSASPAFRALLGEEAAVGHPLDVLQLGSWSLHDLHSIARRQRQPQPFLLAVQLPPPQQQPQPPPTSSYSAASPPRSDELSLPVLPARLLSVVGLPWTLLAAAVQPLLLLLSAPLPGLLSALSPSAQSLLTLVRLLHPLLPPSYLRPALLLLLAALLAHAKRAMGGATAAAATGLCNYASPHSHLVPSHALSSAAALSRDSRPAPSFPRVSSRL